MKTLHPFIHLRFLVVAALGLTGKVLDCAKTIMVSATLFLAIMATAQAQYGGWQHSGSLYIFTTPESANLPGTAVEEGFPLLVRLNKDWFDFGQAQAESKDIRFASAAGTPLAYQIDGWDAAAGTASIWVRIPTIKGNARQEIKMFWGKADAESESKGEAVFNESNGYLSVWHMNDPVNDAVGLLQSKDTGTTPCSGMVGKGRHFADDKGIFCGTNITTYPVGNSPHSTEFWIKTDQLNEGTVLRWGVSKPNSILQINVARPFHIRLDCFYSAAGIHNDHTLALYEWVHVMHTYGPGDSRLYINSRSLPPAAGRVAPSRAICFERSNGRFRGCIRA